MAWLCPRVKPAFVGFSMRRTGCVRRKATEPSVLPLSTTQTEKGIGEREAVLGRERRLVAHLRRREAGLLEQKTQRLRVDRPDVRRVEPEGRACDAEDARIGGFQDHRAAGPDLGCQEDHKAPEVRTR